MKNSVSIDTYFLYIEILFSILIVYVFHYV